MKIVREEEREKHFGVHNSTERERERELHRNIFFYIEREKFSIDLILKRVNAKLF